MHEEDESIEKVEIVKETLQDSKGSSSMKKRTS